MNDEYEPMTPSDESAGPETAAPAAPAKAKKHLPVPAIIALALCFFLMGGVLGYLGAGKAAGPAATEVPSLPEISAAPSEEPAKNIPNESASAAPSETVPGEPSPAEIATPAPEKAVTAMAPSVGGAALSAADVYESTVDSTVGITTSITTNYWGYQSSGAASGSGFIYSADGYIITNYHVI